MGGEMEELLNRVNQIKQEIDDYIKQYADECVVLFQTKGFDQYKAKWQKKIRKIADKYAEFIVPLKDEHNKLCEEIEIKQEEIRKSKYKQS